MAVLFKEFKSCTGKFPSLRIRKRGVGGRILVVSVDFPGIRGGKGISSYVNQRIYYKGIIDVSEIRSDTIPAVYILSPPDNEIKHVNIWGPQYCSFLGRDLPRVCWGANEITWKKLRPKSRTLLVFLELLSKAYMDQNFDSPVPYRKSMS